MMLTLQSLLDIRICPTYVTSFRVICACLRPHLPLSWTLGRQSAKCQDEGNHSFPPLGRRGLSLDNSKMMLILFHGVASLIRSSFHKSQPSPCPCQGAKQKALSLRTQRHYTVQAYAFEWHHRHLGQHSPPVVNILFTLYGGNCLRELLSQPGSYRCLDFLVCTLALEKVIFMLIPTGKFLCSRCCQKNFMKCLSCYMLQKT